MTNSLAGAKCLPGFLRTPEQTAFRTFDYETSHPWESVLAPNYFLPIATWFLDDRKRWMPITIRVVRHVASGQAHWWEMAELLVTFAQAGKSVEIMVTKEPFTIGAPKGVGISKAPEPAPAAAPAVPAKKAA